MKKRVLLVLVALVLISVAVPAMAADEGTAAATAYQRDVGKFLAAAFAIGLAAFAGALGQAKAIAAACTSMGRNPGAAGPVRITMIIGVAFIESLVIYALLIAFVILGK
ncbi:MAG: ATP synthase F0 subunit C [Acidobacteriota bacterium]